MGARISKTEISDEDLIRFTRAGDGSAVETLYSRHHEAGLRFARRLMNDKADAEDIAQDAFLKVVAAIGRGNGPETAFRPYLLSAVRTAAADRWEEQTKETPTEGTGDSPVEDPSLASLLQRDDPELVMKAFQSLPLRWMTVLWHAEVEREPPRRIAPILGIEPGAVSALLLRARKGLREAYLSAYAEVPPRAACEPTFPHLAATVLGTSSARDRRKVEQHARDCEDCAKVLAELTNVGGTMRGILAPLLLIPSGAALPGTLHPDSQLPAKSTAHYAVVLTAAATLIAVAAVASVNAAGLNGQPRVSPGASAAPPFNHTVPAQSPTPSASPATTAGSTEDPVPVEESAPPAHSYPAEFPGYFQQSQARNAPGRAATFTQPEAKVPAPSTAAIGTVSTPEPTAIPTPTPSWTPTAIPIAVPTTSPTSTPTPTPTPTSIIPVPTPTPPTEPCTVFLLLLCLSG